MALIEYDEYKQRLRDLGPELGPESWRTRLPRTASGTTWSDPRRCSSASSSCRTRSPARTSW